MSSAPLGLYTDLYELTMASALLAEGHDEEVTFDLFVRSLPPERDFLVACGLETASARLDRFGFDAEALAYLGTLDLFDDAFLAHLARARFDGDVRAMAEGELVFAAEPILTVTAPIITAQLVETLLINTVGFETMIASKAARVSLACQDRSFVDFSARRDHGLEAAVGVARASYVGGATATSLVEGGRRFGLPLSGTMAHSYVMAHDEEVDAFRAFLRRFGTASVLLVDTYDTAEGTRRAIDAMAAEGIDARGIRIDSGDLGALAVDARAILDAAGRSSVQILVSGDLDEHRIAALLAAGAPIDAFGVGTRLGTSSDAPYLGMVYKLAEQGGEPRIKLSPGKHTLPGRKQVWRRAGVDLLALADESTPEPGLDGARPLLHSLPIGPAADPAVSVRAARARCLANLDAWDKTPPASRTTPRLDALAAAAAETVLAR